ncbi:hypothetical protein OROHE_003092 [Orobanche hederae]
MAPRISTQTLSLCFLFSFVAISYQTDEYEPTIKTMEAFSGYQIHEPSFQGSFSSHTVNTESLQRQIDELSTFSDAPAPSVTRILYSEKDVLGRRYVKKLMGLSGLSVREDAVGNIFGRCVGQRRTYANIYYRSFRVGSEPELAPVSTGSHIDAIPYSGKYDGVVGVLGAIEAINVLKRSGFKPKRSLEVIMFTSEEPTRFGISCLGSRLLAGSEELAEHLKKTVDSHNISFSDAAKLAGYTNTEELYSVFLENGSYSAFVELHIEQGPILEEEGVSIGVVTAIAAPASIKVDFEGSGGHAGAVLMPKRTVGILELHPGAINSIPSKSYLEIDTRDTDEKRRNLVIEKTHQSAMNISKARGVKLSEFKIVNQDPPALSEDLIIKATESACRELNLSYKNMISRAYHDSLFMARISPMGMIFIPCYKVI